MVKQIVDKSKFTGTRLPANIKPVHYDLFLKPNFKDFTFAGHVKIDYISTNSGDLTNSIVLNAEELEISEAELVPMTRSHGTTVTYSNETITLEFEDVIPTSGTLRINFTGSLNDKLKGFYRTTYKVEGETVYAAATQFEATDARRCFPCWDEPAVKATFSVSLLIEKNMTIGGKQYERLALSNMPEISRSGPDSEMLVKFDKSPIMSTYLLAIVIGPFDMIEIINKGRAIRVYTTPGNQEQGRYALDVANKSLSFYEEYFGIDYPLPKMDLIAVPDFASGAMENWGLITYRERALLVDQKNSGTREMQYVAIVVAHEIAHQWFGNLVTMEWWTHLWLNEGFASFMEYMCVDHIFPDYDIWSQFVTDNYYRASDLDALHSSHPIEVPVKHPSEIREIFDAISYSKGATVLRMLYEYIGDASFRKGMNAYLTKFAYKNTFTEDLWDSLEEASGKPIRELMSGWTSRKGYPWLDVQSEQVGNSIKLSIDQSKFSADGKVSDDEANETWMVPISALTGGDPKTPREICLLNEKSTVLTIENVANNWLKLNPGCTGLYRTAYSQELSARLFPAIASKSLPAMDRLNLQDDLFALCQAGKANTADLLKFLQAFKGEDNYTVWLSIDTSLSRIKTLLNSLPETYAKFSPYCCGLFAEIHSKLKWDVQTGEPHSDAMTRGLVLNRLVTYGDKTVIEEAKTRFKKHVNKTAILPADIRSAVYKAIATYGDDESYENLFQIYRTSELSEEKTRAAIGLASSQKLDRVSRVIEFVLSDEVKLQDKVMVLMPIGANHPNIAFKLLKDKKDYFIESYGVGHLTVRLVKLAVDSFTSEEMANEVEKYFQENKFPGVERAVQQSLETIRLNARWLARDAQKIDAFLSIC